MVMQTLRDLEYYVVSYYGNSFWDNIRPRGKELRKDPQEIIRKFFFKDLPTKTRMFREYVQKTFFQYVQSRIKDNGISRILSLPCSNGEEAYTLAILGLESDIYMEVVGMDVNPQLIEIAFGGKIYIPTPRFKNINPWIEAGYVRTIPKTTREQKELSTANIEIAQFVMDRCEFFNFDVLEKHLEDKFDAIYCLNLFVYLTDLGKETALKNIVSGMNSGSLLIVDQPYWVLPSISRPGLPRYNGKNEKLYGWKVDLNEFYSTLHEKDLGLKRISITESHNVYEKV